MASTALRSTGDLGRKSEGLKGKLSHVRFTVMNTQKSLQTSVHTPTSASTKLRGSEPEGSAEKTLSVSSTGT